MVSHLVEANSGGGGVDDVDGGDGGKTVWFLLQGVVKPQAGKLCEGSAK